MRSAGRWLWAAIGTSILTASLLFLPTVRAVAQQAFCSVGTAVGGFCRGNDGSLTVSIGATPLPVAGGGAPLPGGSNTNVGTQQSAGIQVLNNAGTQLAPVQLDANGRIPVSTPAPAPTDGNGHLPMQPFLQGGNGAYPATVPDVAPSPVATTGPGTAQIIAAVAGQNIYVWFAASVATGTESAATFQYVYGTGTNCNTGTRSLLPTTGSAPATSGNMTSQIGGATMSNVNPNIIPASEPYVIPASNALCWTTAGTTIAEEPVVLAAQH